MSALFEGEYDAFNLMRFTFFLSYLTPPNYIGVSLLYFWAKSHGLGLSLGRAIINFGLSSSFMMKFAMKYLIK